MTSGRRGFREGGVDTAFGSCCRMGNRGIVDVWLDRGYNNTGQCFDDSMELES